MGNGLMQRRKSIFIKGSNPKNLLRRKKEARKPHVMARKAKLLRGIKAKLHNKERFKEKIQMRKM